MKRSIKALGLACSMLVAAGSAQAHRTWLLPQTAHINAAAGGKPTLVNIDAVASEDLFEYEIGLQLGQVLVLGPDGKPLTPEASVTARNRTSFDVKLDQVGSYRVSNNAESVFANYKLAGETKRWRGKAAEYAAWAAQVPAEAKDLQVTRTWMLSETFVSKERAGLPPFQPSHQGLELQALTPLTDLSNGDVSRVRLLLDGQPLPDATVTVLRGGSRYRYKLGELTLKTDAQGELSITWPEAGRYWLGLGHEVAAKGDQAARRFRYSATFEVLPK